MLWDPKVVEHVAHLCEQSKQSSKGSKVIELSKTFFETSELKANLFAEPATIDVVEAMREPSTLVAQTPRYGSLRVYSLRTARTA